MLRLTSILIIALSATPASALNFKFSFNDVVFDDGGTAAGSFLFDTNSALPGAFSEIAITTTDGTSFTGRFYDTAESSTGEDQMLFTNSAGDILELQISENLSDLAIGDQGGALGP